MEFSNKDLEDIKKVKIDLSISEKVSGEIAFPYKVSFTLRDSGDREVGIPDSMVKVSLERDFKFENDELKFFKWLFYIWFREESVGTINDEIDDEEENKAMKELYGGDISENDL